MINRIREVRRERAMTLADVAARCVPPTTAQTIGRLETGTRSLSLAWMNRIAAALGVEPELLVRTDGFGSPRVVARLTDSGVEALAAPRDAILPADLAGEGAMLAMAVVASAGEYRAGDQVWCREASLAALARHLNRDVLCAGVEGGWSFGRLLECDGATLVLIPPGAGRRPITVESTARVAVAEMLVRSL